MHNAADAGMSESARAVAIRCLLGLHENDEGNQDQQKFKARLKL